MRTLGGFGYLLVVVLAAIAIDRMTVSLVDAAAGSHPDRFFASLASPKPAPDDVCAKSAPTHGQAGPHSCATPAPSWSTERRPVELLAELSDLWASIRRPDR